MKEEWIIALATAIFFTLMAWWWKRLTGKVLHRFYKIQAKKVYRKLQKITGARSEGRKLCYLRKVNPYVFEELLLLAFQKKGYAVIHNKRYSGDGGMDGQVIIKGKKIPIQAKRYRSHIRKKHVETFEQLMVKKNKPYGLFIHTGKTGKGCKEWLFPHVRIISGQTLIHLLEDGSNDGRTNRNSSEGDAAPGDGGSILHGNSSSIKEVL